MLESEQPIHRVQPILAHLFQGFDQLGLVLAVGDAVPFVGTGQHMDVRFAGLQRVRHDGGQVIFALHRVDGQAGLQERGKTGRRRG